MLTEIKIFLNSYNLLNKDTHFLVGFSGGADSMLLLYYMKELQKNVKFKLSALHINHGWRGEESDTEQKNCEKFCEKYKINFCCEHLDSDIKKDENSARIARYILFKNYAQKLSANAVLTAHNSTDVIETFIYRLVKGMGTKGAISIPECRKENGFYIYRPLINVSSLEIRKECDKLGLKYNIDSSNFDNKYKRNLIRNEICPQFKKINPEYENAILGFIENLKSNNKIVEEFCYKNCDDIIIDNKIITGKFLQFSDDIKRVIIYKYLKNNNIDPEKKIILRLIKQIEQNCKKTNGKKYSIKNSDEKKLNISFFCSKAECYLTENKKKETIYIKYEKKLGSPFTVKKYEGQKIPTSNELKAVINIKALKFPLELRTRKAGDVFQPFSHNSKVKLKDYLIEKKIPEHKRNEIPLLCSGKEVLWIIGVGISELLRANSEDFENSKLIIFLK